MIKATSDFVPVWPFILQKFVEFRLVVPKITNQRKKWTIITLNISRRVKSMTRINATLRELGIQPNYVGYREIQLALQLTQEDSTRLTALIRRVYAPVGLAVGKDWTAVERNLRTVIRRAWEINPVCLTKVAGRPLESKPETGEFLAMMYTYLSEEESEAII